MWAEKVWLENHRRWTHQSSACCHCCCGAAVARLLRRRQNPGRSLAAAVKTTVGLALLFASSIAACIPCLAQSNRTLVFILHIHLWLSMDLFIGHLLCMVFIALQRSFVIWFWVHNEPIIPWTWIEFISDFFWIIFSWVIHVINLLLS